VPCLYYSGRNPTKYRWENFTKKIDTPAKYVQRNYIESINIKIKDFEHLPKVLPTIAIMVPKYTSNYWIKSIMETEGNTVFIPYTFNENKFQMNKNWYNYRNEMIDISGGRISMQRDVLMINNLTFSDRNLYKCVSSDNEFYTVVIVTKNWIKKSA